MNRRERPWRLSTRLGWRLAAVMVAAIALASAVVAWRTLATIRSVEDAALQSQARLVAQHVVTGPDQKPVLTLPAELQATFDNTDSGNVFIVCDAANTPLLTSDGTNAAALLPYLPPPPHSGFFRVPPGEAFPQGALGELEVNGPWRVVVAQQLEQQEALVASLSEEFLFTTLWLLVPLGLGTVAIGVLTIRSGLRSVREVSAAAGRVGPDTTGVRLPVAGLPREVAPLVGAVNQALERLERALDAQRRFSGDAAHALRTPLAVLAARIDSLPVTPDTAALSGDADRLGRLVSQMLASSRLDGLPLDVTATFDLHAVAASVLTGLAPLAVQGAVELALTGEGGAMNVRGDAAAVETALENLVHNAILHAPPGSEVTVELVRPARVRVLDRGPGVPAEQAAGIFGRFRTGRAGGAGLGLSIVAGVAAAHRGSVRVDERPGGGAVFVLDLPG